MPRCYARTLSLSRTDVPDRAARRSVILAVIQDSGDECREPDNEPDDDHADEFAEEARPNDVRAAVG